MDPSAAQFLGVLAVILVVARLFGMAARTIGQPAVLGELLAGVVLGASVLGLIHPNDPKLSGTLLLNFFAEVGVVILLFKIGLETDLPRLLRAGPAATLVTITGVALSFAGGYAVCRLFGLGNIQCIVAGAALTATSVGISARVLDDLGRLHAPESQIVLGAAVIDDVLGLIILAVVESLIAGGAPTVGSVAMVTAKAFGFLIGVLVLGSFVVPPLVRWLHRTAMPGVLTTLAMLLAFGLAWAAQAAGSASIIGAFAAGLLLRRTPQAHEIEKAVLPLDHFFVPLFFVVVGAAVDIHAFFPRDAAGWRSLEIGGVLIVAAVLGKLAAGYAPFWFRGKKAVIGAGMVPRGEVTLIVAEMGKSTGAFNEKDNLFSALTLVVMVTTFLAPPLLRMLFPPVKGEEEALAEP
jgi:Kef-type K+ transport system membrane component KefB